MQIQNLMRKILHSNADKMLIKRSVAAMVCICLVCGLSGCKWFAGKEEVEETKPSQEIAGAFDSTTPVDRTESTEPAKEETEELSITDLLKAVITLKDDLETALDDVKNDDIAEATSKIDGITESAQIIHKSVNATVDNLGDSFPSLKTQLENIQGMLDLLETASDKVLKPAITQLQNTPISEMKSGDGINTKLLCEYIDFAESIMPEIENVVDLANGVDLGLVDDEGKIAGYLETANKFLELYQEDPLLISRVKAILGAEGDRLYMIAAQNSAEIRASGGFPGAVGTIRIQNGILKVEDFRKVYDVLSSYTPSEAKITNTEYRLFHGGLSAPRDADYCPDFERVAYIWSLGYEAGQKEPVDGVISVTPSVVQKLLAAMNEEITLFDGTVLNGDNATKTLQHDLYFKYFGKNFVQNRGEISDQLFADAAKKAMQKLMDNMEVSNLLDYFTIAKEGFEERTLMLWMKDASEQAIIAALGWNGGLNTDPQNPQAGIYYNCTVASKMGWFLLMDTEIGERVENADGSFTYPITVTFSNDMTQDEISSASALITGGNGGAIGGSAYFFAPAGGKVSDFKTSNGVEIQYETYHDLQLGFMRIFNIYPNKPVTVTYNVTTAPGVETPLQLSKTPTVQEYH